MIEYVDRATLAKAMGESARTAGEIALRYFRHDQKTSARVEFKDGGSPVSEADLAIDHFLREQLLNLRPGTGWLSEESTDDARRLNQDNIFIVDPIDGTRAYINGDRRWGISLALVSGGEPQAGVLFMPALDEMYCAVSGGGATLNGQPIRASTRDGLAGARIAGPKKALDALERQNPGIVREPRVPSLAYRMVRVASASLDGALASTDAWDWDIAAADLIVRESGGILTGLDGAPPRYNLQRPRHGVLAAGGPAVHGPLVGAIRAIVP